MALNYTNFRSLADRLISENGRALTIVRRDQSNFTDPAKPWRGSTEAAEVSTAVTGVFIEYEKEDVDGDLVRRGDKRVLIAAKDVEDESASSENVKVEDYDHVLDGTVRWKILSAELIEPGSQRIMYDVQVRA
jgi:hypothetical protein